METTKNIPDQQKEKAKRLDDELSSGTDSGEEDEGCDIEFPRESAEELLQFLHRELNTIDNKEDG
jgi:hypothetical protein